MVASSPPTGPQGLPAALTNDAGYLMVRLGQDAQRRFQDAIAVLDLRPSLFDYLATLGEQGPCSQKEVATILGIDAARIVTMTDAMEQRGIVERAADATDRRRNLLSLTRSGRSLLSRAERLAQGVEAEMLAALSVAERQTIRRLLRRMLDVG